MKIENWKRGTPLLHGVWGQGGKLHGFQYQSGDDVIAWHITTVHAGEHHDYWITEGRFHRVLKSYMLFTPPFSMLFETDDEEANPSPEEREAVLSTIRRWETGDDHMSNVESPHEWHNFDSDDLETHPSDGAKILAELEGGTQAQAIYQAGGGGLSFPGGIPEGVGKQVTLKRWRYLNIP